ncbi:MAG: phospholipase [Candidatus Cloacimonadota bacterium]|nr:MAG: phospholipase [Candidatus Cloacimonadota bacterium]
MKSIRTIFFLTAILFFSNLCFGESGSFTELTQICKDGKERPFIVYTPSSLDKSRSNPLLVFMHGAVSSPFLKKDPLEYMKKSDLLKVAEEGGFYLMFSYGQKGATWFDNTGIDMVLKEIEATEKKFNINSGKIFLSGFSDGGSGVFCISMKEPFKFAGFIPMNGSIAIAQKFGKFNFFMGNTNNIPFYIINTTKDQLYPLNQIEPTVDYLKKFNSNVKFRSPKGNHEMSYIDDEKSNIVNFINNNSRGEVKSISWETDILDDSIEWISGIKADSSFAKKDWHTPYNLRVFDSKAKFGIKYDYTYRGEGLKVKTFKYDSCTARKMGVIENDIILMMENDSIKYPYSPFIYLSKKTGGDSTSLTLLRDNKEMVIKGKFNKGYFYRVFKPSDKSGKIEAFIEDKKLKVKSSRVQEFTIDFDRLKSFDIEELILNGKPLDLNLDGLVKIEIKD